MSSQPPIDNYPGERTLTETARLRAQHDLVVDALGGLLLCHLDTTQQNLRILDVGTADGWFLHCVRSQLACPDTATLVGTDVAPYPDVVEDVITHNFKTPFPEDWKDNFDLVQLRAVMANVPGDAAIDLVRRAWNLVKPGGFIQLIDGAMPAEKMLESDKPSARLFKTMGAFLVRAGMDASQGARVAEILQTAAGDTMTGFGSKERPIRIGKGSQLEKSSWDWLRGFTTVASPGLVKTGMATQQQMDKLTLDVMKQAQEEGFDLSWFAAWGRKS
ncbi:uncharacterized protein HMPREF1541_09422 [Cyphellophora europaea CBS 101466]|uniref:Methyltransferase domain-containing protein n=1 Tax=Cyphellophora europaea (strain CBS 101466) TaxID=1220924 RepID=W2SAD0_CYPE1|nr:uncharacterized protein HMPREF1541_09422 [Cyphellophora europaea CBS 101466]ETN45590.1 hypothetical protein HMPREF1541_09422 [Cyphellophora europaea CBS 101466]